MVLIALNKNIINSLCASNHFAVSQQVQPRAVPLLRLRQRRWHLCLPVSEPPSGSPPGCALLHPVWLRTVQSDPPVPASGLVPAPGATQSSRDPPGCHQAGRLPGLPVHHLHHSQAGPLRTQPQAGQEDRQGGKGRGWKHSRQEKGYYSYDLKLFECKEGLSRNWEAAGFIKVLLCDNNLKQKKPWEQLFLDSWYQKDFYQFV